MGRAVVVVVVVLSLLAVVGCDDGSAPRAVNGVLDLRSWKFDDTSALSLQGGWTFYWNKLVEPGDQPAPDGVLPIGRWNGQKLTDGRELGGEGFATYRLTVHLPEQPAQYALATSPVVDANQFVVSRPDGQLLAEPLRSGTLGTTRETSNGTPQNAVASFTAGGDVLITLQVSNFEHARGGSGPAPLLGTAKAIGAHERHRRMADFFVLGLLLLVAVQQLVQFVLNRNDRAALWFGLTCLAIGARVFILGRYPADELSGVSTVASLRLEYLTGYLGVPATALFMRALFPTYLRALPMRALVAACLAFAASVMLPAPVFTLLIRPFQILIIAASAYAIVSLTRAVISERDRLPAALMLVGFVLMGLGSVWEMESLRRVVVPLQRTTQYGLVGFVLFQSTLLALLNRRRSREVQLLNKELRFQIAERSRDLSDSLAKLVRSTPLPMPAQRVIDDRYRVIRALGAGGMGQVYEVERIADGQHLALKTLRGQAGAQDFARFAREAQIAAEAHHPNLLPILDVGISDDCLFLVMPLVEGGSLEQQRTRFGDRAWAQPYLAQIASGLAALHERQIVHRDLKPGNVLLDQGVARIADFGLATARVELRTVAESTPEIGFEPTLANEGLTKVGQIFGTPKYMAPELSSGVHDYAPSADIFAFGLIAYELLHGRSAFDIPPYVAAQKGQRITAPALDGFDPLLARCLHMEPHERPRATELAAALSA